MPDGRHLPDGRGSHDDAALAAEIRALRRAANRRKRLLALAVVGHLLVLLVVVVLPYLRARERSLDARHRYARFAACMVGGEPVPEPGLGLPEGARRGYADAVRRAALRGCLPELDAVAPDPLFWMLPSTRHAERQVRRAVAKVRDEIEAASGGTPGEALPEPIPERPWLALQRLIAALTLWAQEADASEELEAPAVVLTAPDTVSPERVPVRDRAGSRVTLHVEAAALELTAFDSRGVSWVRVGDGGVDARRLRRPRTLATSLGFPPTLLFRTPETSCGPSRCVGRSFGLAPLRASDVVTPEPRWFAAHPDTLRAVHVDEETVRAIARQAGGALELRSFPRRAAADEAEGPVAPQETQPLGAGRQAAYVHGEPTWLTPEGLRAGRDARLVLAGRFDTLATCGGWRVVSGPEERHGLLGDARVALPPAGGVTLLDCDGDALLLQRRVAGETVVHRCRPGGCDAVALGRREVAGALLRADSGGTTAQATVLLATWTTTRGAIAIARWRDALEPWQRPAACFSVAGGFCGPARVAAAPGRVVVAGRQRDDLLVIESATGTSWTPLRGLRRGAPGR